MCFIHIKILHSATVKLTYIGRLDQSDTTVSTSVKQRLRCVSRSE